MFGLGRKIVSGTVVDKHYYPALGNTGGFQVTGTAKHSVGVEVPKVYQDESWTITVEGVDKDGKPLKKEIYVDGCTYGTVEIGAKWPQSKE